MNQNKFIHTTTAEITHNARSGSPKEVCYTEKNYHVHTRHREKKHILVHERVKKIFKPTVHHITHLPLERRSTTYNPIAVHHLRFDCGQLLLRVEFGFPGVGGGNIFASLTCYESVPSSSKHSPSPSISGLTMRNIFITLLCYSRFCRLNCDGCSDFSFCVRHFVKDVAEELFTFTVYKSLEKRFLRKIKK